MRSSRTPGSWKFDTVIVDEGQDFEQEWVDTVRRFKGQQAPAVILVDAEEDSAHPERMQRVLFTGMTRATVRAELVLR